MKRQKLESTSLKPGIYFSTKASVSCGRPRESKCGQFQPMRPSAFAFKKPFQGRMLNGKKIIKHFCKEQTRSINFLGEFDSMEPKTLFQQKNANYSVSIIISVLCSIRCLWLISEQFRHIIRVLLVICKLFCLIIVLQITMPNGVEWKRSKL